MEKVLSIQFGAYRIVRVPDAGARAKARRSGTRFGGAPYTVVRPDGRELCCAVSWREVERLIEGDGKGAKGSPGRKPVKAQPTRRTEAVKAARKQVQKRAARRD